MTMARSRRGRPRKDEADKLQTVSVSIPPGVKRALNRIATRRGLKISEVIRRIIVGRLDPNISISKFDSVSALLP